MSIAKISKKLDPKRGMQEGSKERTTQSTFMITVARGGEGTYKDRKEHIVELEPAARARRCCVAVKVGELLKLPCSKCLITMGKTSRAEELEI